MHRLFTVRTKAPLLSLCGRPCMHSSEMARICTSLQKPPLAPSLLTFRTVWTLTAAVAAWSPPVPAQAEVRGAGVVVTAAPGPAVPPSPCHASPPGAQLPLSPAKCGTIFLQVGLCERVTRRPRALQSLLRSEGTGNRAPPAAPPDPATRRLRGARISSCFIRPLADRAAARHGGPNRRCLPWRAPRFPEVPGLPLRRRRHLMGYLINPSISPAVQLPRFLIILHSLMINLFPLQGCGWFKVETRNIKKGYLQSYKEGRLGMGNWILSGFLIYEQKSFHCVTQALNFPL